MKDFKIKKINKNLFSLNKKLIVKVLLYRVLVEQKCLIFLSRFLKTLPT